MSFSLSGATGMPHMPHRAESGILVSLLCAAWHQHCTLVMWLWKPQQRQRQAENRAPPLQSGGNVSTQQYRTNSVAGDAAGQLIS